MKNPLKIFSFNSFAQLLTFSLVIYFSGCNMKTSPSNNLGRNEELPLFEPHTPNFICMPEKIFPLDAEAERWFQQARELESAQIFVDDRDYNKIVALTRQSAERNHWKAMLNLASLYLEGKDKNHGVEDAVQLVESAMKLGIPDAYDRMGTYYMNGTGVNADATRAYAFWQRAAQMGSADALTFLGEKLQYLKDRPNAAGWANIAVGIQMLECAYSKGSGNAAFELSLVYSIPAGRAATKTDLARALNVLHGGVKLGCQKCAASLWIEFSHPVDPLENIAPFLDEARTERYRILSRALDFDPERRFPNLDKIIPLPPADLPPWNGDRDTLLDAARGVSHPPSAPPLPSTSSKRKGRFFLAPEYRLVPTDDLTEDATAPFTGYWQPMIDENQPYRDGAGKTIEPGLYQVGERFERIGNQRQAKSADGAPGMQWRNWRTVRHDQGTISPPVVSKRTRLVTPPEKPTACAPSERCPITGIWQPWVHTEHPEQNTINQYWRQTWLVAGQRFPHPQTAWMLDVPAMDITWHLMDCVGVDIAMPTPSTTA